MSEIALCPHCGNLYEKKENLWQCPHCRQAFPVSEVKLTTLAAALCYLVEVDGKEVIGQRGRVLSMMMDLMPGNQKAVRVMKAAYLAAEPEMVAFAENTSERASEKDHTLANQILFSEEPFDIERLAEALQKEANQERKSRNLSLEPFVENLLKALHQGYLQPDKADQVVSALLEAFRFDSDALLGGNGHGKVYALSHDLHMDAFARAICDLQRQNGSSIWKDANQAVSAMATVAPQLKEEMELLSCVGKRAGKEFYLLMQALDGTNSQADDKNVLAARLRMRLEEEFIDSEAVGFFLECISKATDSDYAQSSVWKKAETGHASSEMPVRPRNEIILQDYYKSEDVEHLDLMWKAVLDEIEKCDQAGDKESQDNPELAREYYAKGLEIAKKFNEMHQTRLSMKVLSVSYEKMGEAECSLKNSAFMNKYLKECLILLKKLCEHDVEVELVQLLCKVYELFASDAGARGDDAKCKENYEMCYKFQKKVCAVTGTEQSKDILSEYCLLLWNESMLIRMNSGKQDYAEELKWIKQYAELEKELYEKTGAEKYKCSLDRAYRIIGGIENGSDEESKKWYGQSGELGEERYRDTGSAVDTKWKEKLDEIEKCNQAGDKEIKKNPELARDYYAKGLKIAEKFYALHQTKLSKEVLSVSYEKMGDAERDCKNVVPMKKYYKECAELLEELCGDDRKVEFLDRLCKIYVVFAMYAWVGGNHTLERENYEKCYKLQEEIYQRTGTEHSKDLMSSYCDHLGDAFFQLKEYTESEKWYIKAAGLKKELYEETGAKSYRLSLVLSCYSLGKVEQAKGSNEEAKKWYKIAFKIGEEICLDTGDTFWVEHCGAPLGDIAKNEGDYIAAREWYKKTLAYTSYGTYEDKMLKKKLKDIEMLIERNKK